MEIVLSGLKNYEQMLTELGGIVWTPDSFLLVSLHLLFSQLLTSPSCCFAEEKAITCGTNVYSLYWGPATFEKTLVLV